MKTNKNVVLRFEMSYAEQLRTDDWPKMKEYVSPS